MCDVNRHHGDPATVGPQGHDAARSQNTVHLSPVIPWLDRYRLPQSTILLQMVFECLRRCGFIETMWCQMLTVSYLNVYEHLENPPIHNLVVGKTEGH